MKWLLPFAAVAAFLWLSAGSAHSQAPRASAAHFASVDVWLDSGATGLAAWQLELRDPSGRTRVVGVEGGDHAAYAEPAHYDPKALMGERIVLAAFSTSDDLPHGRTRVARVHLRVEGEAPPDLVHELVAAADAHAATITNVRLTLETGTPR